MPRYNIIQAIVLSLFSKALYRDVLQRWQGMGFGYMLLVIALGTLPLAFYANQKVSTVITTTEDTLTGESQTTLSEEALYIIDQIPDMVLQDGVLSTEVEQPFVIHVPEQDNALIIINTHINEQSPSTWQAPIMVTERGIFIALNDETGQYITYTDILNSLEIPADQPIQVTNGVVAEWVMKLAEEAATFPPLVYIGALLSLMVMFIFRALLYGLIGLLMCPMLRISFSYQTMVRLAAVASTPVIFLTLYSRFFGSLFVYETEIYALMHTAYIYFALDAYKKGQETNEP